jgi:hypothetical protein
MAKRRKSFFGALPKFNVIKKSVKGTDVLMGVVAGLAGVGAMQWAKKSATVGPQLAKLPAPVVELLPALGGLLGGAAGYVVGKKLLKKEAAGAGWLVGAASVSAAIAGLWAAKKYSLPGAQFLPALAEYNGYSYNAILPEYSAVSSEYQLSALENEAAGLSDLSSMALAANADDDALDI